MSFHVTPLCSPRRFSNFTYALVKKLIAVNLRVRAGMKLTALMIQRCAARSRHLRQQGESFSCYHGLLVMRPVGISVESRENISSQRSSQTLQYKGFTKIQLQCDTNHAVAA